MSLSLICRLDLIRPIPEVTRQVKQSADGLFIAYELYKPFISISTLAKVIWVICHN
jgi:hypothetical protein